MSVKVAEILIRQGVIEEQSIEDSLSIQGLTESRLQQTTQNVMNR
jgi:hypothetical protein